MTTETIPIPAAVARDTALPGRKPATDAFIAEFGPNWFGAVMGTGILATAARMLPVTLPGLTVLSVSAWVIAVVLLAGLCAAAVVHAVRHPDRARRHHLNLAMAPFYGMPPMAVMTVGAGALVAGRTLIGEGAAVHVDELLWSVGTIGGLLCAVAIPYLMFARHTPAFSDISATWILPVVPPMVSAAAGAGLIAHLPAGQDRLTLLIACYALFGVSLIAAMLMIGLVWARLTLAGVGPARGIPTLWIVLGPLGTSVTAAVLLGHAASAALAPADARAASVAGLLFGVPVWGFALVWMLIASVITLRTAREHLPFSLTWWSFTFPVGTVVTGTSELALRTGADVLKVIAVALYTLLIVAWGTAAWRTLRGTLSGSLFDAQR